LRGFSVARLPLDSNTTNLPFPLIPPAKDSAAELDNCATTESAWPKTALVSRFKVIITKRKVRRNVTNSSKITGQIIAITNALSLELPKTINFMFKTPVLQPTDRSNVQNSVKNSFV